MNKLNANEVRDIFLDCLFKEEEIENGKPIKEAIYVDGVMNKVGFCKDRIKENESLITELLDELPKSFKEGYSFLNLCEDKNGYQWGEHRNCDELMMLGIAIGKMKYLLPREMWAMLSGGMPYVQII